MAAFPQQHCYYAPQLGFFNNPEAMPAQTKVDDKIPKLKHEQPLKNVDKNKDEFYAIVEERYRFLTFKRNVGHHERKEGENNAQPCLAAAERPAPLN